MSDAYDDLAPMLWGGGAVAAAVATMPLVGLGDSVFDAAAAASATLIAAALILQSR